MNPWLWLIPVVTFLIGLRISSGRRVPAEVAVVVLIGIVLLSRVIS